MLPTNNTNIKYRIKTSRKSLFRANNITSINSTDYQNTSSLELIKLCSQPKHEAAWQEFYQRFNSYIEIYVKKAWKLRTSSSNLMNPIIKETIADLIQEVYVKLLESDRQALQQFQGETEGSFLAYLSKIASNIVSEYFRKQLADKRRGSEMSIEMLLDKAECEKSGSQEITHLFLSTDGEKEFLRGLRNYQISQLVENFLAGTNRQRDMLIFRSCLLAGMSAKQVIEAENLDLKTSSVESILRRIKDKLRQTLKTKPSMFQLAA